MFIRHFYDPNAMISDKLYPKLSRPPLYPNAFPFDRSNTPSVVPCVITGQATGVTSLVDLWGQGIVRTLPTAGFTFAVSSSSTNDVNTSGSGAWIVEVDWLDTDYKAYTTQMNLNGQSKVTATVGVLTCLRINDVRVISAGTGKTNAGDVYVYDSTDIVTAGVPQTSSKIFHKIVAGDTVARGGFYCVPAGCQMQTQQFRGGFNDVSVASRAAIFSVAYNNPYMKAEFPISGQIDNSSGMVVIDPDFPLVFDEKTDIIIKGNASASSTMLSYIDCILFHK